MKVSAILRIAGEAALCLGVLSLVTSANGQSTAGSTSGQPTPPAPRPARVKLDGFDLSQGAQAKHSANQIGGASRGIGAVKLFAPEKGLAYSLHPTFQWSGSPDTKYKLEIEDLAAHTTFDTTVDGTTFTYPETAAPLKPGSTYSWKVQPEVEM